MALKCWRSPPRDTDAPIPEESQPQRRNCATIMWSFQTCCNLLAVPALAAALIVTVLYFQNRLSDLESQLDSRLDSLSQLETYESDLATFESNVSAKLDAGEKEVQDMHTLLNSAINATVVYVNNTVYQSQTIMNEEVETVNDEVSTQSSLMAYQFAGTFTILGIVVFVWHSTAHLRNFHEPNVQRKILAILWMCPLYGVTSWLSLVWTQAEGYLAVVKDFYEAYCIYTFLSFLISVLGRDGGRPAAVEVLSRHADHLNPPIRCFGLAFDERKYVGNPQGKAEAVLYQCQLMAMQFVLLRPLTSIGLLIANATYGKNWDLGSPQFFLVLIINGSIFLAFSGLVKFYHAVREDLKWCRPFPKFLCIKGVVFMTFWQGMAITILAKAVYSDGESDDGSGGDGDGQDAMEWSKEAQNFLICLEMLFFAIAHCFVFPTEEWEPGYRPKEIVAKQKFGDKIALRDFVSDVKLIMKSRKKHRIKRSSGESPYEGVPPEAGSSQLGRPHCLSEEDDYFEEIREEGEGDDDDEGGDTYIVVYKKPLRLQAARDGESSSEQGSTALVVRRDSDGATTSRVPVDWDRIEGYVAAADSKECPGDIV